MSTFEFIAQVPPATQPAPGTESPPWWANSLFPIAIALAVFYLIVLRPQKNKDKARNSMLSNLKRGDRVQTIGGILGTVVEATEEEVVLKVDETSNTKIKFARTAIHRVREEEKGGTQS